MRLAGFCLPAGLLALVWMLGAASPVAGTWEGEVNGAKAITLRLQDKGDQVVGTAVFYILHDEGSGEHNGSASGEIPLISPVWDGHVLRFSIHGPHGESGNFALRVVGPNVSELTVDGRSSPLKLQRGK